MIRTLGTRIALLLPLLIAWGRPLPAAGSGIYRVVAQSGAEAPGVCPGSTFTQLGIPVVNGLGEVAFTATVAGPGIVNGGSVWTDAGPSGLHAVLSPDMNAPGVSPPASFTSGARFLNLNDSGRVAFVAFLAGVSGGEDSGIWGTDATDALVLHAREGAAASGTSWQFGQFGQLVSNIVQLTLSENGEIAFRSATSDNGDGIWSGPPGAPAAVALKTLTPVIGAFKGFSSNVSIDPVGRTCFLAEIYTSELGSTVASLWSETAIGLAEMAETGDDGGEYVWAGFDEPKRNQNGTLVFDAALKIQDEVNVLDNTGIWAHDGGGGTLVAREGSAGPGAGGTFLEMTATEPVVNAGGDVLFFANIYDGVGTVPAMWLRRNNVLTLLAIRGQTAPGTEAGTTFKDFTTTRRHHINGDGDIVFFATVEGPGVGANSQGIWRVRGAVLEKLVRQGDQIELAPGVFREVAAVNMGGTSGNEDGRPKALGEGGHTAFHASFWSGETAVVVAEPASLVGVADPERGVDPLILTGETRAAPNPTRAACTITFSLSRSADASVGIYDVSGRRVFSTELPNHPSGTGRVSWDGTHRGRRLPAGLYAYSVTAGSETVTGKILRVR